MLGKCVKRHGYGYNLGKIPGSGSKYNVFRSTTMSAAIE